MSSCGRRRKSFCPSWRETRGNDGYVSFELDPLLEDFELGPPMTERVARYIALGQAMVGRPQEPHDQGAGNPRRAGGPGGNGGRRDHDQRDAHLHRPDSIERRATQSGAGRSGSAAWKTSKASTASLCRASTCTRKNTCRNCRRLPKGWWASSARNASGPKTASSGATSDCRWPRRSCSPAPAPRNRPTRPGNTWRRLPAATSRPTRRPRTRRSSKAA